MVGIISVKEGVIQLSLNNRKKRVTDTNTDKQDEVLDRLDRINNNLANIRSDIAVMVHDTVWEVLKKHRKYVEVGY